MNKLRIGQKLSLGVIIFVISNIMTSVQLGDTLIYCLIYSVSPLIVIIPLVLIKKELPKTILSWILLLVSIPTMLDKTNDISNMNGYFLFLFSVSISTKSPQIYIIYFSVFIMTLLNKFNITFSAPSQIVGYIGGLYIIGVVYENYIHPKKQTKQYIKNYLDFPSKKYLLDVMELYIKDKTWNEIAKELYPHKTGNSLRKDVKKDITKLDFESYGDFILYLGQNGIIKAIDKNLITY
jgi:hypothetical protein